MIKPNELRIGNLLHDRHGRLCKVELLSYNMGDEPTISALAIVGGLTGLPHQLIPLTEQWLLKFGFKETIPGWFSYESFTIPFKSIVINLKLKSTCIASETDSISIKNIEFVHALQNTFFALTGEELQCT